MARFPNHCEHDNFIASSRYGDLYVHNNEHYCLRYGSEPSEYRSGPIANLLEEISFFREEDWTDAAKANAYAERSWLVAKLFHAGYITLG